MPASLSDTKLYKYHVENLRSLEIALKNTATSVRKAISEENTKAINCFVRLNALLLGAWAEIRLNKLLYEQNGFTMTQRNFILSQPTQLKKWLKAVEVAFREKYCVPSANLTDSTLTFTAHARYSSLTNILKRDLRPVIEIRNKLAHGQWIYPLNNKGDNIEQEKYLQLNNENLPSLQYKLSLLSSLADILHDLIVSLSTFERDFDTHYRQISTTKLNLDNRKYEIYSAMLVKKRQRGIEKRKKTKMGKKTKSNF